MKFLDYFAIVVAVCAISSGVSAQTDFEIDLSTPPYGVDVTVSPEAGGVTISNNDTTQSDCSLYIIVYDGKGNVVAEELQVLPGTEFVYSGPVGSFSSGMSSIDCDTDDVATGTYVTN